MSNTPKIRFSGFTEDWEQRKVTDLGEIYIGLVTTMTEHYTDKGHLLIRNSDIKDGYFEFGENPIYLDEEFSEQNKSRMHQLGDVITVHTGDIGTSAVIGENEVNSIGFATIVTRPNQEILDSNYFATYLNTDTHKQWAVSMATGDGRSNYNLKDYTKLVVPIPEIEEQKKIAACIVNINSLITLHQRKYDDTKLLKKYMLQKMFPQNGQKVPEIRFSGFTGDWEQRKLGDTSEKVCVGFVGTCEKYYTDETGIPMYRTGNLNGLSLNKDDMKYVTRDFHQQNKKSQLKFGDILIARHGDSGKAVNYESSEEANCLNIVIIRPDFKKCNYRFLTDCINSPRCQKHIKSLSAGSTQAVINTSEIEKLEVLLPGSIDEQEKVAAYFENLDHLITLHQRKCDELKELKKYMLQNMFPQKG